MHDHSDAELLHAFAARREDDAFAELVRRYASLVYGATLRRTGDHCMAEETAQNVFATLARRAGELATHPALAAWLQKTAAFEALRAMEKETNRRRLMRDYTCELAAHEGGAESWPAALPLIDSALAALTESDRQVILLRYWQELPFKKIAETVGGSAAACEKRAERAIEKLSRILHRKGAPISAMALVAGLTPNLAKASAALAVMARITSRALTTAKIAPAASGLISTLLIMKSKLTPAAILAALIVLCGTGGWVAGRSLNRQSSDQSAESIARRTSIRIPSGSNATGNPVAQSHGSSLRALLQAAQRDLSTATYDPPAKARAAARIAAIAPDDIRAALAFADELIASSGDSSPLASLILGRWAEFDGLSACEAALVRKEPFLGMPSLAEPVKVWAARDPEAAFTWFRANASAKAAKPGERWKPISSLRWIMGAWSLRDMNASVRAFSSLTDKAEIEGAMVGFQEMSGQAPGRTAILDAYLAMSKSPGNAWSECHGILQKWSDYQPAELAAWLDKSDVPQSSHDSVATPILTGWLREDAKTALDWWLNASGGHHGRGQRMDTLINAWTEADVFAAAEWLAAQPPDATAASSMRTLAAKIARSDPERGWAWALSIPHAGYQKEALNQVIAAWALADKAAATGALATAPLDQETKTLLTNTINKL